MKELWYSHGGCCVLEDMLQQLSDDNGAFNMVSIARQYGEIHLFGVHMVFEP